MASYNRVVPFALMISLVSTANAEMKSISDGEMANVTAKGGLTIDYSGLMAMGEFRYEDSGAYVVDNIRTGGAGITDSGSTAGYGLNFDNARLTLDVASDGGLDIMWQGMDGGTIDYGFEAGRVAVRAGSTGPADPIFNGLQGWGLLRTAQQSVLPASETGLGRSAIYHYAAFTLEDLSSSNAPKTIGINGGYVKSPDFMGNSLDAMDLTDQIPEWGQSPRGRSTTTMDDLRAGFAAAEYSVYTVSAAEAGTPNSTLQIGVSGFAADIGVQNLTVGQSSLGQMTLDNLQISDTIVTLTP